MNPELEHNNSANNTKQIYFNFNDQTLGCLFWEDGKLLADKDPDRSLVIDGVRRIIACQCQLVSDVSRGGAPGEINNDAKSFEHLPITK